MEKISFNSADDFYVAMQRALYAMHALSMKLHYTTCDGVGWPPKDDRATSTAPT